MTIKRITRVTVEIERRSISITQTESRSSGLESHPSMPRACAICGASWVLVRPELNGSHENQIPQIFYLLLQRGLHNYFSAAGQLWVCSRSFQQLSETL